MLWVGMSNTSQEYGGPSRRRRYRGYKTTENPNLVFVNGAQGGV